MGFADLHTDGGDRLYVIYKWQDRFYDMDGTLRCYMFNWHHSSRSPPLSACVESAMP